MPKVEYSLDNYNRCLCGGCPMNRSSACVKKQEEALAPVFAVIEQERNLPESKTMPGVYCAVGKSACDDFDDRRMCLCPGCSIHITDGLSAIKYCTHGSAEEVG